MDVILELVDTFALDHLYATLLPLRPAPYDFPDASSSSSSFPNATLPQAFSTWHYKPATSFLRLEPSAAAYASSWPRDYFPRQAISLFFVTWFFGLLTYFIFASLSYYLVFDHRTLRHPKFLKNQVRLEIAQANKSMPLMSLLTAALFLIEVRGHGKLYDRTEEGPGRWYDFAQIPFFLFFTDGLIYFIHRGLHHPAIYKHFHKAHHKWIMPTPFASHAFHPLDGFAQGLPYHLFPLLFPLQKLAYVGLFIFINFWTIMIHDGEYMANNPMVNGSACHTAHHLYFNYNYGQFFTLWDRIGGSYRKPDPEWFDRDKKMSQETWQSGISKMEKIQKEVEGDDDRTYEGEAVAKKTQ